MKYGKPMTMIRRIVAQELRRVRAEYKPATPWDTCVVAAAMFGRQTICYRTLREVAIKFNPSASVIIDR